MHKMIIPNQCFVDFLDTHKYTQFNSKVGFTSVWKISLQCVVIELHRNSFTLVQNVQKKKRRTRCVTLNHIQPIFFF